MKKIIPSDAVLVPDNAQKVFTGQIFEVYQWPQKMFDGSTHTFEMLKRPDTIEILAIKDDKIVILEEEQPNLRPYYAIPGGRHDVEGETELDAAKRELVEETGMRFKTWKLLNVYQPAAKIEQMVYQFLATDFGEQIDPHLDAGEKIKVDLMTLEEAQELCSHPRARHLPKEILGGVNSLEELINLPEFSGQEVDR